MRKAIVTGANGFIGSALVQELISNGVEVIALVHNGRSQNIPKEARIADFELSKCGKLFEIIADKDIDAIYHMAWDGSSGDKRADYQLQLQNVKYTCDLLYAASKCGIKKFIGAGTLVQFDCDSYIGLNNSTPNAVSCYGTAKIAAQYMSKAIANSLGIEHVWCFISNTYGVGNTTMNFVNMAVKKMLNGERAAFTAGNQNYDFVYITDTITGIYLCGEKGKNNSSYYIGSGKPRQLKDYIYEIRDTVNSKTPIYLGEIPFNGVSIPLEKYSCENACKDLGYRAKVDFSSGIIKTVEWLKAL